VPPNGLEGIENGTDRSVLSKMSALFAGCCHVFYSPFILRNPLWILQTDASLLSALCVRFLRLPRNISLIWPYDHA